MQLAIVELITELSVLPVITRIPVLILCRHISAKEVSYMTIKLLKKSVIHAPRVALAVKEGNDESDNL